VSKRCPIEVGFIEAHGLASQAGPELLAAPSGHVLAIDSAALKMSQNTRSVLRSA
jgi:hypothetical protein